MKAKRSRTLAIILVTLAAPSFALAQPYVVGATFTYQGRLLDGGLPADGDYDFEFALYDDQTSGSVVASPISVADKQVSYGLFTVGLDFGDNIFKTDARWLRIGVRPWDSTGAYTYLDPRQELTPAPYALALPGLWTEQGGDCANLIGGYRENSVTLGVIGAVISGGGRINLTNDVTDNYGVIGGGANNQAGNGDPVPDDIYYATVGGGGWNTATAPNSTIAGGYNNVAGALNSTVGGGHTNIASGSGATAGGGSYNTANGDNATIAGGTSNEASTINTTVGGGLHNTAGGATSTVGGGGFNVAGGSFATIPGGFDNEATGDYSIAAGRQAKARHDGAILFADSQGSDLESTADNQFLIRADGGVGINNDSPQSTLHVSGTFTVETPDYGLKVEPDFGEVNFNYRHLSSAASRMAFNDIGTVFRNGNVGINTDTPSEALDVDGTAKMTGFHLTTGPTTGHVLTCDATGVGTWQPGASGLFWQLAGNAGTTAGINFLGTIDNVPLHLNVNNGRALRIEPTLETPNIIGGHPGNSVTPGVLGATIAGGGRNSGLNKVGGNNGTVSGGAGNQAILDYATIGGGLNNFTDAAYATIGGGGPLEPTSPGNQVLDGFGTIGGGASNLIGSDVPEVLTQADYATIGGGAENRNNGDFGTIGGGSVNYIGPHAQPDLYPGYGRFATVPGGFCNAAYGDYSFAAGFRAKARHEGTFVWADRGGLGVPFESTDENQFLIRTENGVGINLDDPTQDLDVANTARLRNMPFGSFDPVHVDANGVLMRFEDVSSRRYKDNIEPLCVPVDSVCTLEPVRFHWIRTGEPDVGLIAEEVDEVLPELVKYDDQGQPNGVRYNKLVIYLLSVVKEQQQRLAMVEEQEQRIADLAARLERIEAQQAESADTLKGGAR